MRFITATDILAFWPLRVSLVGLLLSSYPFLLVHLKSSEPRAVFSQILVPADYPLWIGVIFIVLYIPLTTMLLANRWKIQFSVIATILSVLAYIAFMYVFVHLYPFSRFSRLFVCSYNSQICLPALLHGFMMVYATCIAIVVSTFIFRWSGRVVFRSYHERHRQHAL
jgi:hypothetical protein